MCDVSENTQACGTQQVPTSAPNKSSIANNSGATYLSDTPVADPKTYLPQDSSSKFDALMDMSISQLKKMLKDLKSLVDGSKEQLAVRVIRHLAGLPLTPEDALLKQKQDEDAAGKKKEVLAARRAERENKRISVKRTAPKRVATSDQVGTLNTAWPRTFRVLSSKVVRVLGKPKKDAQIVGFLSPDEEFKASGELLDERSQLFFLRLVGDGGWVPQYDPKAKTRKLVAEVPKNTTRRSASREVNAVGLNPASPQKRSQRKFEQAPETPPKRMKPSLPADVGAIEVFVKTYISGVDIHEARLKDLYTAVRKRFGTLHDEHWNSVKDMATNIIACMAAKNSQS